MKTTLLYSLLLAAMMPAIGKIQKNILRAQYVTAANPPMATKT